ncbi:MAG: hypothetical protein M1575_03940 [Patescibacteria group bacterium]|nr:hypothetical protein [Patescibacteria group bacterium]MCL5095844.1 hypothetical protein [Patescibacteria group bacterium]
MINLKERTNLSCPTGESLLKACGNYRLAPVVTPYNWPTEVSQKVRADLLSPQKQIGQSFEEAIKKFRFGPVNIPPDLLAPVARKAISHIFEHEEGPDVNQLVVENICAILSRRPPLTQEEILRARGKTRQLFETVGISLLWYAGLDSLAQPAEILVEGDQATAQILVRERAWNALNYILFGKPEQKTPGGYVREQIVWQEALLWRETIMANLPLFYRRSLDSLDVQRIVDITCLEAGEKAPEVLAETAKTIGVLLENYFRGQKKEQGLIFETNLRAGLARNLFGRNSWATANFPDKSQEPYKPEITHQQAEKLADCLAGLSWREIPEVSEEAVREAGKLITLAQHLFGEETVKKGVFLPRLMGALDEAARFYKIDQIEDSVVRRRPIEDYAKEVVSPFLVLGGDFACKSEFNQEGTYRLQVEGLKRTSAPGIFHNYLTRIATRMGLCFPMSAKIDLALVAEGQTVSLKVVTKELLEAYYQGSKAVTVLVSPKFTWGLKDD